MTQRSTFKSRRGTTTVESAIVLSTVFLVLFVIFDLGLATFLYNTLSAVARRTSRELIVHGAAAAPERTVWGPTDYESTAADSSEIASAAAPLLATMTKSAVAIEVSWPDGDNREGDRVVVRLRYVHQPVVPFLSLSGPLDLRAESMMRIVH